MISLSATKQALLGPNNDLVDSVLGLGPNTYGLFTVRVPSCLFSLSDTDSAYQIYKRGQPICIHFHKENDGLFCKTASDLLMLAHRHITPYMYIETYIIHIICLYAIHLTLLPSEYHSCILHVYCTYIIHIICLYAIHPTLLPSEYHSCILQDWEVSTVFHFYKSVSRLSPHYQ